MSVVVFTCCIHEFCWVVLLINYCLKMLLVGLSYPSFRALFLAILRQKDCGSFLLCIECLCMKLTSWKRRDQTNKWSFVSELVVFPLVFGIPVSELMKWTWYFLLVPLVSNLLYTFLSIFTLYSMNSEGLFYSNIQRICQLRLATGWWNAIFLLIFDTLPCLHGIVIYDNALSRLLEDDVLIHGIFWGWISCWSGL